MKGKRGDTFNYNSNYWTSTNTLNETDVSLRDADAKYATFNYSYIKDILAIFPDIPSTAYTNIYGQNGGSLNVDDGWAWKVDNWFNYAPPLDAISASARSSAYGIYALIKMSNNYVGPTLKLRRSSDNAVLNFYADIVGNFGTLLDGDGTPLATWLGADTAYVDTWYDQSGGSRHATQPTSTLQPRFDTVNKVLDFEVPQLNAYMLIPNGTVPLGNTPYTFVLKHGTIRTSGQTENYFIGAGVATVNYGAYLGRSSTQYMDNWYSNTMFFGTMTTGNVIASKYSGTYRYGYVNGAQVYGGTASGRATASGQQYIGKPPWFDSNYANCQLYFVHIFGTYIGDNDRNIMEATGNFQKFVTLNRGTALNGFQATREADPAVTPTVFPGYSANIFSTATAYQRHIFGGAVGGNANARWGFIFNDTADPSSCNATAGIGLSLGSTNLSAGDYWDGTGTGYIAGINRPASFRLFGR
ncbi:MAG: hypothetical protein EHM20_05425 [Alphaproteobacteria bacterium]|nr:MAG: hypothetical protein EHM20_05425 [Alphaproteobacteria bacterium]